MLRRLPRLRTAPLHPALLMGAICLLEACTGTIRGGPSDDPPSQGRSPEAGSSPGPEGSPSTERSRQGGSNAPTDGTTGSTGGGEPADVGLSPLRRLTNVEYDNTLAALLGDKTAPSSRFLPDSDDQSGFTGFRAFSPIELDRMREAAEEVAARATTSAMLEKLLPCVSNKTGETACATDFVRSFGRRAFRRPLSADEVSSLVALYTAVRKDSAVTFAEGIAALIEGVLQDPRFLYHRIVGNRTDSSRPGERVRLTSYEVAEQLSYYFLQAPPDDALTAEADADRLNTTDAVGKQARRLLADPRSHAMMTDFYEHWLHLGRLAGESRDPKAFPDFNEDVRKAMREGTKRLVETVVFAGDGRISTLLTTTNSFVNGALAPLYGLSSIPKTRDFAVQALAADERAGLLTQPSFLTSEPSLIRRGKFVRERLFCQELSPPPANANPVLENPDPKLPVRDQFAQHSSNPACSACHKLMDPIGFGFTNYDAIGKFRRAEAGKAVDPSGVLQGTDVDGPFSGVVALAQSLARSQDVRRCFASLWFRYVLGRSVVPEENEALRRLQGLLAERGDDVRELVLALVTSDSFLTHKLAPGEEEGQGK